MILCSGPSQLCASKSLPHNKRRTHTHTHAHTCVRARALAHTHSQSRRARETWRRGASLGDLQARTSRSLCVCVSAAVSLCCGFPMVLCASAPKKKRGSETTTTAPLAGAQLALRAVFAEYMDAALACRGSLTWSGVRGNVKLLTFLLPY